MFDSSILHLEVIEYILDKEGRAAYISQRQP